MSDTTFNAYCKQNIFGPLAMSNPSYDYVHEFVPENEAWIDNALDEVERPYVLLYERNLMAESTLNPLIGTHLNPTRRPFPSPVVSLIAQSLPPSRRR